MLRCFYGFFCGCLLISLALSGCGFHLRGYGPQTLTLPTLYLVSNPPYTNFSQELRASLMAMGVDVRTSPPAHIMLQILSQNFSRTITSLGNAGQTTTYLLSYTVLFQLIDTRNNKNHILLPPQQIRTTRNFSIATNQLSGDLNIQGDLKEAMQNDLIQQLIMRLAVTPSHQRLYCPISR